MESSPTPASSRGPQRWLVLLIVAGNLSSGTSG